MLEVKTARKLSGLRTGWFVKHAKKSAVEHVRGDLEFVFSQGWHQQKMEIWRRFCRRYSTWPIWEYIFGGICLWCKCYIHSWLCFKYTPSELASILKLMGLGRTLPLENPMQFALKVCHCNIPVCKMLIFWWTYSMRQSFGSIRQHNIPLGISTTFRGQTCYLQICFPRVIL